ncbi:hypothetical protein QYM36_017146 [Artemia franciscana]|uniref:Uncharacterized protein n=1 Tax=Artemia franciscana TaxID=6661 RepID=A0AA88KWR4_ARTSF|nr:hypothetical protein QYM36_017146 [Artemia franciscana]
MLIRTTTEEIKNTVKGRPHEQSIEQRLEKYAHIAVTSADKIPLILHFILRDSKFEPAIPDPENRELPNNWAWRNGVKNLLYVIKVDGGIRHDTVSFDMILDYPKVFQQLNAELERDWLETYKSETVERRRQRETRKRAVWVPENPPFTDPWNPRPRVPYPVVPDPGIPLPFIPNPDPHGPEILPGPAPFPNPENDGLAGDLLPRRRHDFRRMAGPGNFGGRNFF